MDIDEDSTEKNFRFFSKINIFSPIKTQKYLKITKYQWFLTKSNEKPWYFAIFMYLLVLIGEKICFFEKNSVFIFLSYLMYNLSAWHRGTPTVTPVGAVNVPLKIRKIKKNHDFEYFWELFFLINY